MINKISILLIPSLLFCLAAQARGHKDYVVHYDVSILEMVCEVEGLQPHSVEVQKIVPSDDAAPSFFFCYDDSLTMNWTVKDKSLEYVLLNKATVPQTININEMTYRDVEGKNSALGYSLTKPRNVAYAVVEPDSVFMGFLVPVRNYASSGFFYDAKPLVANVFPTRRKAWRAASKHMGDEMVLLFPVHIGDVCRKYKITFAVTGVRSISERSADDLQKEQADELALRKRARQLTGQDDTEKEAPTIKKRRGHKLTLPSMQEMYPDLRLWHDFGSIYNSQDAE